MPDSRLVAVWAELAVPDNRLVAVWAEPIEPDNRLVVALTVQVDLDRRCLQVGWPAIACLGCCHIRFVAVEQQQG